MSRFSGPQRKGAARDAREQRRAEALERQKHKTRSVQSEDTDAPEPNKDTKRRRARKDH